MADEAHKCPHCGSALKKRDNFCPECGENLSVIGKLLFGSFLRERVSNWTKAQQQEHFMSNLRREMLLSSGWGKELVDKLAPHPAQEAPPEAKPAKETKLFIQTAIDMASYLVPIIITIVIIIIILNLRRCS